jgi:hypothetical protein
MDYSFPLMITGAIVVIILSEAVLWWLFQKKMTPLSFPHELDASYFRFFSMSSLRAIALVHTFLMCGCIVLCSWYLW